MSPHSDITGDLSSVNEERARDHMWEIIKILSQDKDDLEISYELKAYVKEKLNPYTELYIRVGDLLAEQKILTRAQFKAYMADRDPDFEIGDVRDL